MKLTRWLLSAMVVTASPVLAQITNSDHHANPPAVVTPAPAPAAPATVAPSPAPVAEAKTKPEAEAKPKARRKHRKSPTVLSAVDLNPPVTAAVTSDVLNVRGQPSFNGEVIDHLRKGDTVTVMEEITLANPRPDEPDKWSLIALPTNAPVWVDGAFIDSTNNTVRVKRVNIRGGPGENYSILGRLDKGTAVQQISEDKGWWKIETPANAYAFVASEYLDKQAAAPTPPETAATETNTPPPTTATPAPPPTNETATAVTVPEQTPAVPAKGEATPPAAPAAPVAPAPTPASEADQELAALRKASAAEPATDTNAPEVAPAPAVAQAPSPTQPVEQLTNVPRVVTRDGFVHRAYNIQAPADYELHDIQNGELIEYLQPASGQRFKIYVGTRVSVTGTEVMDQRWPRTPILEVQKVELMP